MRALRQHATLLVAATATLIALAGNVAAAEHAVVLLYHHVDDSTPASTSVSPEQFRTHLDYLSRNQYRVRPLAELVRALESGNSVPDRSVALTFDDAYQSVHDFVLPELTEREWPFTVFANTAAVQRGSPPYMNWTQLETLAGQGVAVENHSHTHAHLAFPAAGESDRAWQARVRADILDASMHIEARLGHRPTLFAYPYGEYTPDLAALVAQLGLTGFGQHSGAVGVNSDFLALPRFPFARGNADLERLGLALQTRPLYVTSRPAGGYLSRAGADPLTLHLTLTEGPYQIRRFACYAGGKPVELDSGSDPHLVRLKMPHPLGPGRTKLNCTAPAQELGAYFWWSYLVMQANPDGTWYAN